MNSIWKKADRSCTERNEDCFAWKAGYCMALEHTNFHGKLCPFYKSGEQVIEERLSREEELTRLGRLDILDKYAEVNKHLFCNLGKGVMA